MQRKVSWGKEEIGKYIRFTQYLEFYSVKCTFWYDLFHLTGLWKSPECHKASAWLPSYLNTFISSSEMWLSHHLWSWAQLIKGHRCYSHKWHLTVLTRQGMWINEVISFNWHSLHFRRAGDWVNVKKGTHFRCPWGGFVCPNIIGLVYRNITSDWQNEFLFKTSTRTNFMFYFRILCLIICNEFICFSLAHVGQYSVNCAHFLNKLETSLWCMDD